MSNPTWSWPGPSPALASWCARGGGIIAGYDQRSVSPCCCTLPRVEESLSSSRRPAPPIADHHTPTGGQSVCSLGIKDLMTLQLAFSFFKMYFLPPPAHVCLNEGPSAPPPQSLLTSDSFQDAWHVIMFLIGHLSKDLISGLWNYQFWECSMSLSNPRNQDSEEPTDFLLSGSVGPPWPQVLLFLSSLLTAAVLFSSSRRSCTPTICPSPCVSGNTCTHCDFWVWGSLNLLR